MVLTDIESANKKLNAQLVGAQLDKIAVSSIEFSMCFMTKSMPIREIWVTTSGRAASSSQEEREDFFEQRGAFLSLAYSLIGNSISKIGTNEEGCLSITIGKERIVISPDEECFEEIWSVTPDNHSPYQEYDWFVTYTDDNELLTK
ncbi:hypothetical protein [Catenovulum agarivorans]|uniref:hypothetical protein n=1 Tax=Catenovulum agarivorans TaxID=1172192 RepID=UPI00037ED6B2|nr:hypothetical protein [Catenovulum agarivorans]